MPLENPEWRSPALYLDILYWLSASSLGFCGTALDMGVGFGLNDVAELGADITDGAQHISR